MSEVSDEAPYLDYAVRWRAGETLPGRHDSRNAGAGGHFRAFRPFWQLPDARQIDVRRSMIDPFGEVMVRQTENRSGISIVVAADLSRSMRAAPGGANWRGVTFLAQAACRSAHRAADAFGFVGFDAAPRAEFSLPPTRNRGVSGAFLARLRGLQPDGRSGEGIAALAPLLPLRRSLVVLVSDFLMPPGLVERALAGLARHDVAPVVLHEARETTLPRAGLMRLRDAETGRTRLLLMRPSVVRRWQDARRARRDMLDALFLRHCRPAFHAEGFLDIARLGEHLLMG